MKNTRKLLAVILCFTVLSATFAFNIAVSATEQTYKFNVLKTGFEENTSKDSSFYSQASNGYANDDRSVGLVNSSGIGNNGSNYAMKMGYNNNPSNTNLRPVFSLRCSNIYNGRSDTQSFKFKPNYTYTLSFYYKAETVTSTVQLWMRQYGSSLSGAQVDANSNSSTTKLAEISVASSSYKHVEATFTATANENLIFLLRPTDYTNVAGTTVYIDDITVTEHQTLDSDAGIQDFESITTVANSVANTTLTGRYNTGGTYAISTEQNHTEGGSKSVKMTLKKGAADGSNRPRMLLKVNESNFVATKGESYIVSFWIYAPEAISTFNWYIYSQTSDFLGQSREGQQEIEKSNVSLAAGWNKITQAITITGFNSSEHNFLQFGLTDSNAITAGYGDATKDFYLDDIKIMGLDEHVTSALITQDFTDVSTLSGKGTYGVSSSVNNTAGGGKSAYVSATGYKSGVSTPQFYIPGSDEATRLCGEYNTRYRMRVSVYSASDVSAKIRWCGATTLSDAFNYATNHRVIAEENIDLAAGTWTELTLVAITNADIFEGNTVYFTLGATLADSGDSSSAYTINFDDISVNLVTKPGTPDAPVVASFTNDSVTLETLAGGEYSLDNSTWQDSNTFTGLTPWNTYTFYQRKKATETTIPSDPRALADYVLVLRGDLNMSSVIESIDHLRLIDVILENDVIYNASAADVNADEVINIRDLMALKNTRIASANIDANVSIG